MTKARGWENQLRKQ